MKENIYLVIKEKEKNIKQDIYEIDYLTGELRKYDYVEEIEKMKNKKSQIISKNYKL